MSKTMKDSQKRDSLILDIRNEASWVLSQLKKKIAGTTVERITRGLFRLSDDIAHLTAFLSVDLKGASQCEMDVIKLKSKLKEYIPKQNFEHRQAYAVALGLLEGVCDHYLEVIRTMKIQPKPRQLEKKIEGLSAEEILSEVLGEKKTPIRKSKHPAYEKFEGLHPLDKALIDEFRERGVEIKTQQELDRLVDLAIMGAELDRTESIDTSIVKSAAMKILEEKKTQSTEELSEFGQKMVELAERRKNYEKRVEELLSKAADLTIKNKE